jgi:hypothetical protein
MGGNVLNPEPLDRPTYINRRLVSRFKTSGGAA